MLNNIAQGLLEIHSKKIIHRDIKPENIVLKNDIYKITDFGISIKTLGMEEEVAGTPLYWPP